MEIRVEDIRSKAAERPSGYVEDVLSHGVVVVRDGVEFIDIPPRELQALRTKYRPAVTPKAHKEPPSSGPGTELKALLKDWLGIQASPNCSCNARARQMDEWGPDLCEQNLPTILQWLEEQAKARKLPFVRFAAEQAVKLAIRRARKKAAQ